MNKKKESKVVPNVRFKGFTDDWKQRKLSDAVDVRSGRDYKHLEEGDIPVYGTGGYMLSVSEALSDDEDAIGIGRKGTIDNPYILRAPFWTVDTLFYAVPREKYNLDFVYGIFQNINWKAKDESTGVPSLSKATINAVSTMAPDYEEQSKIGEYFSDLDHLITLHQRKIDKLKNLKKAMLEKMFPKKGTVSPEIRFNGFANAWEQRKLGDVCEVTMGQSPDGSTYSDEPSDYILVQGNADLKDGWVVPRVWTSQKTKTAQAGDLIMSVRAPVGAMGKTAYDIVIGRGVAAIKGNEFIYQTLVKYDADGYWKKLAVGSTFESVNSNEVKGAIINVPQDIEEQKKIGEYFLNLDHLITLHQRKIDKLKNLKKAMLDQMFI